MSAAYDIVQQFDPLLTEIEAAQLRKQSVRTLQGERYRGDGCSFVRLGRSIRYRRSDVLKFIECHVKRRETREARKARAAEVIRKLFTEFDEDEIALLKEVFAKDLVSDVSFLLRPSNLERAT